MKVTVQEADSLISESVAAQARFEKVELERSHGRVLAEDVLADRGYPPFHRVVMDGIAIRWGSFSEGTRSFAIEAQHKAGDPSVALTDPRGCIEVMTGSTLPERADAVVPYEQIRIENGVAHLEELPIEPWQNIHLKDSDCEKGAVLLKEGLLLDAAKLGIAASVGKTHLRLRAIPRVAIVSTGDELVEVGEEPLPHQIRRSNVHAIRALLASFGFDRAELFHVGDTDPDQLRRLSEILDRFDFLVLSGGVSMGKFDFVPGALADLKVRNVFHKVSQKPGKPLWFGVSEKNKVVFGLPGNPVSALICARRYVVPALRKLSGLAERPLRGRLALDLPFDRPMTLFAPVRVLVTDSAGITATPLEHNGSGDFVSLRESDGFIELAPERAPFGAGGSHPLYLWSGL